MPLASNVTYVSCNCSTQILTLFQNPPRGFKASVILRSFWRSSPREITLPLQRLPALANNPLFAHFNPPLLLSPISGSTLKCRSRVKEGSIQGRCLHFRIWITSRHESFSQIYFSYAQWRIIQMKWPFVVMIAVVANLNAAGPRDELRNKCVLNAKEHRWYQALL